MSDVRFKQPTPTQLDVCIRQSRQLQAEAFASSLRKLASLPKAMFRK